MRRHPPTTTRWVRTAADLAVFREQELTPARILGGLGAHRAGLLAVDPGVGKSVVMDKTVDRIRKSGEYDLVVYLTAQRRTLEERPFVQEFLTLSDEDRVRSDILVLEPRPRKVCGSLDADWRRLEASGCSALGRQTLCGKCPAKASCSWPQQLSKDTLRGKRIIGATQAYITQLPDLVARLQKGTGASRVLVILDESAFLDEGMRLTISHSGLEKNLHALRSLQGGGDGSAVVKRWVEVLELALDADLELGELPVPPAIGHSLSAAVQAAGLRLYPDDFQYLLFDVAALRWSPRWRAGKDIGFIRRPHLKAHDHLVIAAGIPLAVARQRLNNNDLQEVFPGVRFLNETTRVFNLRSGLGAAVNFDKNAPQILFAVAQLIFQLAAAGKRSIVVSKKRLAARSAQGLERYLREVTSLPYRVVLNAAGDELTDSLVVPLITYGSVGTNAYEGFDAAIALNSYNARPDVLDERLNDAHRPSEEVRVDVDTRGGRRRARAKGYFPRLQGFDQLAQEYQAHLEAGVAVQALGRVRFATRPRLAIFFQSGDVPYPLENEFRSLEQLRLHFGLSTRREWLATGLAAKAKVLAARGLTRAQVAKELGVSERTVTRAHAYPQGGDTKPN